jgi:hypothetical protein
MERRSEPRIGGRLVVTILGRDKSGQPFTQEAVASSVSEVVLCCLGLPDTFVRVTYFGSNMQAKGRASKLCGSETPNLSNSFKPLYTASIRSLARGRECDR